MRTKIAEPACTEVTVSASVGGKIQIVKYEASADFYYSESRKYSIPEGWTEDDVDEFQREKVTKLRTEIEPVAQAELDALYEQRS